MLEKCKQCGATLVDGPAQERSSEYAGVRVTVRGIPVKVCPQGCPGYYWYWPDLAVEVIEMLYLDPERMAAYKAGLFRDYPLCRACKDGLRESSQPRPFTFRHNCHNGTPVEITLTAPAWECPNCQRVFLPPQRSGWKQYYSDLADAITESLTADLLWE